MGVCAFSKLAWPCPEIFTVFYNKFSFSFFFCPRKVSAVLNGLSGPADVELCGVVGWWVSWRAVWGVLWLNFLTRELPGTSINNTATLLLLPQILSFKIFILSGKAWALTAIFHVVGCNCLGLVRQVIKTIEQWPQVTSAEKLVSNLCKQECSHQQSIFKRGSSNNSFIRRSCWHTNSKHWYIYMFMCIQVC